MKYLMTAAALCFGMFAAQAQNAPGKTVPAKPATAPAPTAATAPAHPAHNCMRATDKDWASLKLTPEQTTKVKAIQATCMKECGPMMKTDPKLAMTMDKHEAEVKAVLTPEQYNNWMKWCAMQAQAKAPSTAPAEKPKATK